ncbi:MAG: hypothetical protein RLN96_01055, partial [Pseudomonadales bacterium]
MPTSSDNKDHASGLLLPSGSGATATIAISDQRKILRIFGSTIRIVTTPWLGSSRSSFPILVSQHYRASILP